MTLTDTIVYVYVCGTKLNALTQTTTFYLHLSSLF